MSFIHRGQLYQRVEEGTGPELLLKAICAVSARFLTASDARQEFEASEGGEPADVWAREVRMEIAADLDRFSTYKLAALLCIIHHEYSSGRQASGWNLTALATRMAIGMDLHVEPPDEMPLSWVDRETRRRLVWATFCADIIGAGGLPECTTYGLDMVKDRALPSSEAEYAFGIPNLLTPTLDSVMRNGTKAYPSLGINAHHIILVSLGYEVHR